jgi:hypothetical protein
MTRKELLEFLDSGRGRKGKFCNLMGRNHNYADSIKKNPDRKINLAKAEICVKEIEFQEKLPLSTYRIDFLRDMCKVKGMANKLAKYTGVSKQAMSVRLRNKQTISDKQWCMIKQFAKEHGYGL